MSGCEHCGKDDSADNFYDAPPHCYCGHSAHDHVPGTGCSGCESEHFNVDLADEIRAPAAERGMHVTNTETHESLAPTNHAFEPASCLHGFDNGADSCCTQCGHLKGRHSVSGCKMCHTKAESAHSYTHLPYVDHRDVPDQLPPDIQTMKSRVAKSHEYGETCCDDAGSSADEDIDKLRHVYPEPSKADGCRAVHPSVSSFMGHLAEHSGTHSGLMTPDGHVATAGGYAEHRYISSDAGINHSYYALHAHHAVTHLSGDSRTLRAAFNGHEMSRTALENVRDVGTYTHGNGSGRIRWECYDQHRGYGSQRGEGLDSLNEHIDKHLMQKSKALVFTLKKGLPVCACGHTRLLHRPLNNNPTMQSCGACKYYSAGRDKGIAYHNYDEDFVTPWGHEQNVQLGTLSNGPHIPDTLPSDIRDLKLSRALVFTLSKGKKRWVRLNAAPFEGRPIMLDMGRSGARFVKSSADIVGYGGQAHEPHDMTPGYEHTHLAMKHGWDQDDFARMADGSRDGTVGDYKDSLRRSHFEEHGGSSKVEVPDQLPPGIQQMKSQAAYRSPYQKRCQN